MFPPGAVSIITPWPECREKAEEIGTNRESTSRVADPETDMGEVEVEAEEVEKWKMDEYSTRGGRGWRRLF